MKQWGGNQNYRPEKKSSEKKKARRADATAPTTAKTERDFRVGRTMAGTTNKARERNLMHIEARKKQRRKNAIIALFALAVTVFVVASLVGYVSLKQKERQAAIEEQNPMQPTVAIVDENVGNNISSRTKVFVARLEADAKEYNLKIDHVVLPFQKAREVLVFFEGRNEYYKLSSERGSTVQIEDAERMMRYLDGKELKPEYVDIRVEGKAYYK